MGWLFFLSIIGWAFVLMALVSKLRMGHALLGAVCAMLFVSFYFVIGFVVMAPTAYTLIYGGLLGLVAGVVGMVLNVRGMRDRLSVIPLVLFCLLSTACVFLTNGSMLCGHDDWSYWLRIVKELHMFERFPIHADATMYHSDYIPLLASLQYCVTKVFGWQDAYSQYVTFAVLAASVCAIVESAKKTSSRLVLSVLLLYAVACVSFQYFGVRADLYMGALFAAGMIVFFTREDNSFSALFPSLCAAAVLTGFKIYSGLMFAVVLALCMLLSAISGKRAKRDCGKLLLVALLALALALALHFAWSVLYNYHDVMATYERSLLYADYTHTTAMQTRPGITLATLIKGNPRSSQLAHELTAETFSNVGMLIADTFVRFFQSKLPFVLVVLVVAIVLAFLAGEEKKRYLAMLTGLFVGYVVYTLGLFGSYFVQAETAPASNLYLATCSLPILMAAGYMVATLLFDGERFPVFRKILSVAVVALMLVLCPPTSWARSIEVNKELAYEAVLADTFYSDIIADQLTEDDKNKRALLLEASYDATEYNGNSGKTHAYQYYALPMRVIVKQWPYGDYTYEDQATWDYVIPLIEQNRCDLLILRLDDDIYWYNLMDELMLWGDNDDRIGVYDIIRNEDGTYSFHGRMNDM